MDFKHSCHVPGEEVHAINVLSKKGNPLLNFESSLGDQTQTDGLQMNSFAKTFLNQPPYGR